MRSRNKEPVGGDTGIDQSSAKQRWEHSQQQSDSTGHQEHGRDRITIHQMFHEANLLKPALFLPLPATKEWGEDRGAASQKVERFRCHLIDADTARGPHVQALLGGALLRVYQLFSK